MSITRSEKLEVFDSTAQTADRPYVIAVAAPRFQDLCRRVLPTRGAS